MPDEEDDDDDYQTKWDSIQNDRASTSRKVVNDRGRDYGGLSRQQTNFMPYMEGKED
jgi:hypothetical protein